MRLLYIAPPLDGRGGVVRSIARMISAFTERGHRVFVCSPDRALFVGDVEVDTCSLCFGAREPWELEEWVPHAMRAIDRFSPEIVIGYYGTAAGYVAACAGHAKGVPAIVSLRG